MEEDGKAWDDMEDNIEEKIEQEVKEKSVERPKKKKERTDAQKKAWEKALATRRKNIAERKEKPKKDPEPSIQLTEEEDCEAEPPKLTKSKPVNIPKKQKKVRYVYEEEEESSSEEEIVVVKRRPKPKTTKKPKKPGRQSFQKQKRLEGK